MKQFWLFFREVFEVVIISLFTVFIIRTYLVQPFLVSGASMEPNFHSGNYLLIDELSYRFREPQRGEVVVFRYPGDNETYYIKRIVGLPGERVVTGDGRVMIYNQEHPEGFILSEAYIPSRTKTFGKSDKTLGPDEFFAFGDNRDFSFDSRNWGPVPRDHIIGIARVRLFPISEAQAISPPTYTK